MSLASMLPAPRQVIVERNRANVGMEDETPSITTTAAAFPAPRRFVPPAYGHRAGFVPRTKEDFGDGGAFPEIHVMQYPLDMGRRQKRATGALVPVASASGSAVVPASSSSTAVVPVSVGSDGQVAWDAVVRQGHASGTIVHTGYDAMSGRESSKLDLAKPSPDEEAKIAEETRKALGMIVEKKTATAMPTHVPKHSNEAVFIKYTPSEQNAAFNSGAQQRIIRLQQMPVDPLQPPKYKHQKLPPPPPPAPVPVLHSPPRKVTAEDQATWKIPPCVSNWKNIKGYTIPLDKRLAADGRGLQEVQVNDKFAKLSESLFVAERAAREEIEQRAAIMKKMQKKMKEEKEEEFRRKAAEAREAAYAETAADTREEETYGEAAVGGGTAGEGKTGGLLSGEYESDDEGDIAGKSERDRLRRERARELQRELRLESKKVEKGTSAAIRERERDISEKIALGQAPATSKDSLFDQRLFNQDAGLSSGFGSDETYDVYSKPLFQGSSVGQTYRPKPVEGMDDDEVAAGAGGPSVNPTARFRADRGFAGTEHASTTAPGRSRPVEFERDQSEADDPYGLGSLLNSTSSETRRPTALDHIGKRGIPMGLGRERGEVERSIQFQEAGGSGSTSRDSHSRRDRDRDDYERRGRSRHSRSRSRSRDRRARSRSRSRSRDRDRRRY